jgi:hypothetical protein
MAAWPPNVGKEGSRSNYPSQGAIGKNLHIKNWGRYVRLNASGLEKNFDFKPDNTVTSNWTAYYVTEIWVDEDKKNEPIDFSNPNGKYLYWSPDYGWGTYLTSFALVSGSGKTNQEIWGARPGFVPSNKTKIEYGDVATPAGVNPFAVGAAYSNPVPTLNSPGSSSFGVAIGGHVGVVTNVDYGGVHVTAPLGKTPAETIQNIKNALRPALLKKGFNTKEINDLLGSYTYKAPVGNVANSNPPVTGSPPRRGGGGGGSDGKNGYIAYGIVEKPVVSKIVTVRLGRSYETPKALSPLSTGDEDTKPQMIQYVANQPVRSAEDLNNGLPLDYKADPSSNFSSLKFVFPYIPSDVQYSSLSSVWTEIPRGYNYPFLDWSSFQRMKVSFSLIVASTRLEPGGAIVPDGMDTSVDEKLNVLRLMFQTKQPITIYNMDSLLTNTNDELSLQPTQFVMTDLTIEAIRRQKEPPQRITTAQVNITLLEIIVESTSILNISRPRFDEIVPGIPTNSTTPNGPDLWSPTLQKSVKDSIVLPTGTP